MFFILFLRYLIMPSESSFKRHAELVRETLKNFFAVRSLKAPTLVKAAVLELIDVTVALNPFVPFFTNHDLLQELPLAVINALNDFASDNSSFPMPKSLDKVVALNTRIRSALAQANSNKGLRFFWCYFF
jgi:hypothetical protein